MEDKEEEFSDAAKGELAKLSAEAKNLVLHIIHGAALGIEGGVQVSREHVLAIGARFDAFFAASPEPVAPPAAPVVVPKTPAPSPADDPLAPPVVEAPAASQPAEANVPAPAA